MIGAMELGRSYRDGTCWISLLEMGREREQQIRKWGEKERGGAYIVVVERNNKKKMRGMNILLKYLVK